MSDFDDLLKKAKCVYKGDPLASVIARAVRMLVQEEDQRTKKAALLIEEKASEDASPVLCDKAALSTIINAVQNPTRRCPEDIGVVNVTPWGFAARVECKCLKHTLVFDTSTSAGEIRIVDCFIAVAFVCSSMLGTQFKKFCNFGAILYSRRSLEKLATHIGAAVEILKMNSLAAVQQEEARATEQRDSSLTSLSIKTDPRHACRKNSFHTDVVALGQKHHKAVGIVHVTKKEEPSSQKRSSWY